MRNRCLAVAVVLLSCVGAWAAGALAEGKVEEAGWQPLFDGQSVDGWVQRGGKAHYRVEDGCIVGTTEPNTPNTFLCTPREYADFVLEYEFKVDPQLNSGVQIRSASAPGYRDGVVHGYQIEIDPSARAWTAGIYDESRRGWLCDLKDNAAARAAFKQGEWNRVRVEARGDVIKTWLNEVPAAELRDSLTHTGFIALQVHQTDSAQPREVRWRKLRIKDLGDPWVAPPKDALVLLGKDEDLAAWTAVKRPDEPIAWKWADGALQAEVDAGDIMTKRTFGDMRLHVEFNVADNGKEGQYNGNSGVYLQRRYEIQILNSAGQKPEKNVCGAIYQTRAPDYNLARPAGEWQTYDIWFHAPRWDADGKKTAEARITLYHNGTRVHDNVSVPNKTGAGQPEGPAEGPLLLQEHGSKVRFRNVWVAPIE
jgi:hypothetical protein